MNGDDLIASIYNKLRVSHLWNSTLLILLWDEHGGFYDHEYPPPAPVPDHNQQEYTFDQYGVRVPALLISPWVPQGIFRPGIGKGYLDHTTILRFLIDKFQLGPLGNRTAQAASLAGALTTKMNNGPSQIGQAPRSTNLRLMPMDIQPELSAHQMGLIEFSKQLELEMHATPEEIGLRAMRSRASMQDHVAIAKDRVWSYIERTT